MVDRYIEPLGLLYHDCARQAVSRGYALPLGSEDCAFTYARLTEDGVDKGLCRCDAIPKSWHACIHKLSEMALGGRGLPQRRPAIMGILNVTPDSFSDGGDNVDAFQAYQRAQQMISHGADILDIGGESTRPGASEVSPPQEWQRIAPVIRMLRASYPQLPISVDTRHAYVMERALDAGATMINDVSALSHDPHALDVIMQSDCDVVLMHMRGDPQTMHRYAHYDDVVCEIVSSLVRSVECLTDKGVSVSRILVDPGFGFAKTAVQNLEILRHILLLTNTGCRVVCGVSRKRTLGEITQQAEPKERDFASVVASSMCLPLLNPVLRVHNVRAMHDGIEIWEHVKRV